MKKLFKAVNRLTSLEIKVILNYLLFMSNSQNEYIKAVKTFTLLFTNRYKTFCEHIQNADYKTIKFIINGIEFTKNQIIEVLKHD